MDSRKICSTTRILLLERHRHIFRESEADNKRRRKRRKKTFLCAKPNKRQSVVVSETEQGPSVRVFAPRVPEAFHDKGTVPFFGQIISD